MGKDDNGNIAGVATWAVTDGWKLLIITFDISTGCLKTDFWCFQAWIYILVVRFNFSRDEQNPPFLKQRSFNHQRIMSQLFPHTPPTIWLKMSRQMCNFYHFFYSTGSGTSNPPESRRDFLKIGQACALKSFTCWRLKFIHLCHTLLSNELTFVWFSIENLKVHKLMNTHQLLNWISIQHF